MMISLHSFLVSIDLEDRRFRDQIRSFDVGLDISQRIILDSVNLNVERALVQCHLVFASL